jgi:hypothetical protein
MSDNHTVFLVYVPSGAVDDEPKILGIFDNEKQAKEIVEKWHPSHHVTILRTEMNTPIEESLI